MTAVVLPFRHTSDLERKLSALRATWPAAVEELEALVDARFPLLAGVAGRRIVGLEAKLARLSLTHAPAVDSLECVIDLLAKGGAR